MEAHTGSIAAIQALALKGEHEGKYLVMTGGSDALIKVFLVEKSSRTGPFPLALASVSSVKRDTDGVRCNRQSRKCKRSIAKERFH